MLTEAQEQAINRIQEKPDNGQFVDARWWDDIAGLADEFTDCPEWLTRRLMHGTRGDVRMVCAGLGIPIRCDQPALTASEIEVLTRNASWSDQ